MRTILCGLFFGLGLSAASAEVWQTREGVCGEWRSRWDVEQQQNGVWKGTINYVQVGAPCSQRTNQRTSSDVEAVIVGESFFAVHRNHQDGRVCSYYGRVDQDLAKGFELCEGTSVRLSFALRFPPGENRDVRERYQGREQDEWLDDPQTLDRDQAQPSPRLDQFGPRR